MTQSPCKNCTDRFLGCHGLCKDYNEWKLQHKEEVAIEKRAMPHAIYKSDFCGTSPKPGHHRKTRGNKR